jgi:hypothetical protein
VSFLRSRLPALSLLAAAVAALSGCPSGAVDPSGVADGQPTIDPGFDHPNAPQDDLPPGGCENFIDYYDGFLSIHAVFQYDAAGNVVHYRETMPDGTVRFDLTRSYDEKGRRTGQEEEDPLFSPEHRKVTWEYDDQGRPWHVLADGFAQDGGLLEMKTFYRADGRIDHAEQYQEGVLSRTSHYEWTDGASLVLTVSDDFDADGKEDSKVRYTFDSGRWLSRLEMLKGGELEMGETFTCEDGFPGRLVHEESDWYLPGMKDSFNTWEWDSSGRLRHASYGGDNSGTYDYDYDAGGLPTKKTWKPDSGPAKVLLSIFTWGDDGLRRVTRRVGDTDEFIESWTFTRGCAQERSLDVRIAPVVSWSDELPKVPYEVDLQKMWGFPEAM